MMGSKNISTFRFPNHFNKFSSSFQPLWSTISWAYATITLAEKATSWVKLEENQLGEFEEKSENNLRNIFSRKMNQ